MAYLIKDKYQTHPWFNTGEVDENYYYTHPYGKELHSMDKALSDYGYSLGCHRFLIFGKGIEDPSIFDFWVLCVGERVDSQADINALKLDLLAKGCINPGVVPNDHIIIMDFLEWNNTFTLRHPVFDKTFQAKAICAFDSDHTYVGRDKCDWIVINDINSYTFDPYKKGFQEFGVGIEARNALWHYPAWKDIQDLLWSQSILRCRPCAIQNDKDLMHILETEIRLATDRNNTEPNLLSNGGLLLPNFSARSLDKKYSTFHLFPRGIIIKNTGGPEIVWDIIRGPWDVANLTHATYLQERYLVTRKSKY